MVCWLSSFFLSVVSEVFYIKACYRLHSSLRQCSTFNFLLLFSRFFFSLYLFASFLVNDFSFSFFYTGYEIFSLTNFFVACFCFAVQFLWSLGFDIKLYVDVLIKMFAFIWWLCISLIATFLQWCMPSCCYILFLQQQFFSDIHLCNDVSIRIFS